MQAQTEPAESKIRRSQKPVSGEWIVVYSSRIADNVDFIEEDLERQTGAIKIKSWRNALRGMLVRASEAQVENLVKSEFVEFVEENGAVSLASYTPYWHLDILDDTDADGDGNIDRDDDYTARHKGYGIGIYIVDTGVRGTHQEFQGTSATGAQITRVLPGFSTYTPSSGAANNPCPGSSSSDPDPGHGTAVASLAAGNTFGVATQSTIIPVRAFDCTGNSTKAFIVDALNQISNHAAGIAQDPSIPVRAKVVNLSFEIEEGNAMHGDSGVYFSAADLTAIDTAVRNLVIGGIPVVVAAGNHAKNVSTVSPARVQEAITVAGTDSSDYHWNLSNFGTGVDVYAPSADIESAHHTSDTATRPALKSGTSFGTAIVSGLVARYLQGNAALAAYDPTKVTSSVVHYLVGNSLEVVQNAPAGTTIRRVFKRIEPVRGF